MVASCSSLHCNCRKSLSYAEKQRVWSRTCGLQGLLQYSDCALSCALRLLQTSEQIVEIEILATWTCGCQPFSCRCSQNVTLPKRDLPSRSLRFLRAAAGSTSSALCLHYACKRSHTFVQDSGFVSHVERHRFGHGVVSGLQGLLHVFSHLPCYCSESRLNF